MKESLIKVLAFFAKEIHDVRRQPRLMLSLIGGPLLVLAAFGATFRSSNPFVRTALVWPAEGVPGVDQKTAIDYIAASFTLAAVTSDEDEALKMLDEGEVDIVQIVPTLTASESEGDTRPELRVLSREIDPNAETYARSVTFSETNYINRQILSTEATQAQAKALDVEEDLDEAHTNLSAVSEALDPVKIDRALKVSRDLQVRLDELLAALPRESMAQANLAPELHRLYRDIHLLSDDLKELDRVLEAGEEAAQKERIDSTLEEIEALKGSIDVFTEVAAADLVSPIRETYTNLRGSPYTLVVFFAPSVLALLVQQMAVTLASLGLVRERQMGSFEMFRVAPLRFGHLLAGKTLAYLTYVTIAGAILAALLTLLKVPLPAYPVQFLLLLIMLAVASLGIGFLISSLSRSDSQAIQLTMLLLLLSIFFTGFFLPMAGFAWPARVISALIPMTHAIQGFQRVMLEGTAVGSGAWLGLAIITLLSYAFVLIIMRRQYKKVLD
jgi:ABC-2 type transport system permease protein